MCYILFTKNLLKYYLVKIGLTSHAHPKDGVGPNPLPSLAICLCNSLNYMGDAMKLCQRIELNKIRKLT